MAKEFSLKRNVKLKNHSYEGGKAGPTQFLTVPAGTTSELAALERREGSLAYDTDLNAIVYDNGSGFAPIADGSGMALDFSNSEPSAVDLDLDGNKLVNVGAPTDDSDAATKEYVDDEIAAIPEGVTSVNTLDGDITLAAGTNITLTPVGNTITIDATGGGGTPTGNPNTAAYYDSAGDLATSDGYTFDVSVFSQSFARKVNGGTALPLGIGSLVHGNVDNSGNIAAGGVGAHASGAANDTAQISSSGTASYSRGFVDGGGTSLESSADATTVIGIANGGAELIANNTSAWAQGMAESDGVILASGNSAHARGIAVSQGSITASGPASTASGSADGVGSQLSATMEGSQAHGNALAGAVIEAVNIGALAHGSADNTGGSDTSISAAAAGSHAHGITSEDGRIRAQNEGAHAHGNAGLGGDIRASGTGSSAHGYSSDSSSAIQATGEGSHAHGYTIGGGTIVATNDGSTAFGMVADGGSLVAGSRGALAYGEVSAGSITANGTGSTAAGLVTNGGTVEASTEASLAIGISNDSSEPLTAGGYVSFALGHSVYNPVAFCFAHGRFASIAGNLSNWVNTDPLFVLGNGSGVGSESNAWSVDKGGRIRQSGSVSVAIREVTSSDSVSSQTDHKLLLNGSGTHTLTLPAGEDGLEYILYPSSTNTGTWAVSPDGTDTLDASIPADFGTEPATITFLAGTWYRI